MKMTREEASTRAKSALAVCFGAEMIQAILEGRKTQMRLPIIPQPNTADMLWNGKIWEKYYDYPKGHANMVHECTYKKGNFMWVAEDYSEIHKTNPGVIHYKANASEADIEWFRENGWTWRPADHMPRWASRITLEVTDVHVRRLHKITEDEAKAEGINPRLYHAVKPGEPTAFSCETYIGAFSIFWDNRYKGGGLGWDKNPWVWVIDFKRVELGANPAQERTQHEQVT